jgi:uroporphyrinogen-III synthase
MTALAGLTVLVPESRELDLFADMLAAEGATPARCPLVRIADLDDTADADAWIDAAIAMPFDYLILLTGEGVRKLISLSGRRRDALVAAFGRSRIVTRGPKPVRALREVGLTPWLAAPNPTSQGVLAALAQQDVAGRRVGVQLYPGNGAGGLLDTLRARGAHLHPVTPYRYATDAETSVVAEAIRGLAQGRFGLVAFTSSAQLDRLFTVAAETGLTSQLIAGLARTPIAAVGPVMEKALADRGLASVIQPSASFHLKPLVRGIVAWRTT